MPELASRVDSSSGDESDGDRERARFHPMLSAAELEAEREREMQQRRTASERERARMKDMNRAYEALRTKLSHRREPGKKLSKIQCLKFAIEYISDLEESLTMSYNERTATADYVYWAKTRGYIWAKEKAAQMPNEGHQHPPVSTLPFPDFTTSKHSPVNNNNSSNVNNNNNDAHMCSPTHPPPVLSPTSDTTVHGFDSRCLQDYSPVSVWTLGDENGQDYDIELALTEWSRKHGSNDMDIPQCNIQRYDSYFGINTV
ncbi:myogenic factor 6-like [Branchiostoma lanceolatum]|uniref:myogenic factor 6-like n=1 Tax=Branchiostoma lanceolatum TaxID=7740 RepID=UPI003452F44B